MSETVLITGVAGLLGSHVSRYLLDRGYNVVGVDNLSGGYREFVDDRVDFVEADITNSDIVNSIFQSKSPDYVYHFAAYAAVGLSPFIRSFNYRNNVVASANVINGCVNHEVEKLIFTSSMDVYGSIHSPPYTEELTPAPEDPYGIAKYAVEQDIKHASRLFGLRYTIIRPHNVFGVYQNIWDKYRNVLGIWIRQTLSGGNLTVFGDGLQVRSFSDISYYMEPFKRTLTVGDGEIYNVGADRHTTIIDAARALQKVARNRGYNPDIVHLEPRDEVQSAYCDHTKAKRHLNFEDGTDLEKLLNEMFEWAERQKPHPVKLMPYEIEKKMYAFWKA